MAGRAHDRRPALRRSSQPARARWEVLAPLLLGCRRPGTPPPSKLTLVGGAPPRRGRSRQGEPALGRGWCTCSDRVDRSKETANASSSTPGPGDQSRSGTRSKPRCSSTLCAARMTGRLEQTTRSLPPRRLSSSTRRSSAVPTPAALRGRTDGEHPELRLARTCDLSERAIRHERHGPQHLTTVGRRRPAAPPRRHAARRREARRHSGPRRPKTAHRRRRTDLRRPGVRLARRVESRAAREATHATEPAAARPRDPHHSAGRAPLGRLVHAARNAADAQHPQAVRPGREHPRGARVDLDQVLGVERQPLAVDVDRPRALQRDVELLLAGVRLVVRLGRVVGREVHDVGPERGDVEPGADEPGEPVPQARQLVDGLRGVAGHGDAHPVISLRHVHG